MRIKNHMIATAVKMFFLTFICFLSPAFAAPSALKIDRDKPVEVIADSLTVDDNRQTAHFNGNVNVIQGDLRLKAGNVTIFYDRAADSGRKTENNSKNENDSAPSFMQNGAVQTVSAEGGVLLFSPKESVKGDAMRYDVVKGLVTVTGDVTLRNESGILKGQKLIFDVIKKTAKMTGGKGARVRGLVNPAAGKK